MDTLKATIERKLHAINTSQWLGRDYRCRDCQRHMLAYDLIQGYCPFCIENHENFK